MSVTPRFLPKKVLKHILRGSMVFIVKRAPSTLLLKKLPTCLGTNNTLFHIEKGF